MTIRPKLGVTLILRFIIFLIEPIFCLQYCVYISSATIIPLYLVYYIHRSAALIFRTLYPWLYEVLAPFTAHFAATFTTRWSCQKEAKFISALRSRRNDHEKY